MRFRRADLMAFVALLMAAAALAFATQSGSLLNAQTIITTPSAPDASAGALAAPDATIAPTFNFQGLLRNPSTGQLVQGNHTITVKIYAAPVGGSPLNADPPFQNVPVRDGVFNVVVGSTTPLDPAIFQATPRYVGIAVDSDPEMTPRQRIHPVPWAFNATTANNAASADKATTLVDGANVNALNVTGDLNVSGVTKANGGLSVSDLTARTISDNGDGKGNPVTHAPYDVSLVRWVVTAGDNGSSAYSTPLDSGRMLAYCADEDGCSVTIGMRDWKSADVGTGNINFKGPQRLSIAAERTNKTRFWDIQDTTGSGHGGWDGNNTHEAVMSAWDCHLEDGQYLGGQSQGDKPTSDHNPTFYLVNGWGTYSARDMVCVLIIED